MRKTVLFALALMAFSSFALNDVQKSFLENRRIAQSRDHKTIPGSVITTWVRNGKVESVTTNVLKQLTGVAQSNPLQLRLASVQSNLTVLAASHASATNRLSYLTAKLAEKRAEYVEKRDDAKLSTTKAIYQAIIDFYDQILGGNEQ